MLFGFILVIIGLLYLLEIIIPGFSLDFDIIWPIVLMVIGISNIIKNKKFETFNCVLFTIGAWFLLLNLNIVLDKYENIFWPIILMVIGVSIIINTLSFKKKMRVVNKDGFLTFSGVFGGVEEKVKSKDFKGAYIYSVFGGCTLDLSEIEIKDESIPLFVYSIFGGSDIILPKQYNIIFNSTAILGGNENKNNNDFKEENNTIHINCVSVFGGSEFK